MPVELKKDKNGRWVAVGQAQDKAAYAPEKPAAAAKPKPKPGKSWWQQTLNNLSYEAKRITTNPGGAAATYLRNGSGFHQVNNAVRHEAKQLANPATRNQRLATYGSNVLLGTANPLAQIQKEAIPAAGTAVASLVRNVGGAGATIDKAEDLTYQVTGAKPPSEMTQGEKAVADMKSAVFTNFALSAAGGAVIGKVTPGIAAALDPLKAPNFVNALGRGMLAEGLSDTVATAFQDNTGGSALGLVDALFGTKSDPVQPGMSHPEATAAAFGPNAAMAAVTAGGGGLIAKLFPGSTQATKATRLVDEKTRQRKVLEDAGLQQSNPETGQSAFTPEAVAPQPETQVAERSWADAERAAKERLGLSSEPAPTAEPAPTTAAPAAESQTAAVDDQWEVQHDPSLPEADVGLDVIERLDDDELPVALQSDDPVSTAAEIIESRPEPAVDGIAPELVKAPGEALAAPTAPWRSQWQALPTTELQGMALRSPEVAERVLALTGKTWDEATKMDLLDGFDSLAADGKVYLPSRMNPKGTVVATGDIAVAPEVFQFKGNVDAAGRQKGNSLEGVDKWNTDLEGVIDTWDNPTDGRTYVVNGHNRVAMAKDAGVPSLVASQILAGSPEEARAIGALRNIAQGSGTPFDAAKFFRDSGIADQASLQQLGVPMSSGTARSGLALAQLPDNIFQDAVDGKISLGKAQALGEAGLDETSMQSAYKALQGQDMTDGTWSEVLQQAGSAPVVQGDQVDLFGNTETMNLMVQKGDLARRIRAEVSGDKKLFGSVGRNADKLAQGGNQISKTGSGDIAAKAGALLDTFDREKYAAGTPISELLNQGAAEVANGAKPAVVAKRIKQQLVASLDQLEVTAPASAASEAPSGFNSTRYERMSPEQLVKEKALADKYTLSDRALANRQATWEEIQGKEAQVRQYLDDMPGSNSGRELTEQDFLAKYGADESQHPQLAPNNEFSRIKTALERHEWAVQFNEWFASRELTAEDRAAMQMAAMQKAIANGKVRPSATPIPEVPSTSVNLEKAARDLTNGEFTEDAIKLLDDEARLQAHYREAEAQAEAAQVAEMRDATGYHEMTYDQKKALGITEGFAPADKGLTSQAAGTLDERAQFARQQLDQAKAQGDEAGAAAWQQELRQLERSRLGNAMDASSASQQDMFGVGQYDTSTPLLNQSAPPSIDIPAAASKKITAKTSESRIRGAAESLMSWVNSGVPGDRQAIRSVEQAMDMVETKGAILDPDAIPGLSMDAARNEKAMGKATADTEAVARAYKQFYGLDGPSPNALASADGADLDDLGGGYETLPEDFSQLTPYQQARVALIEDLASDLKDIVHQTAGKDVPVNVDARRYVTEQAPREYAGRKGPQKINGWYDTVTDVVVINGALTRPVNDLIETAYHESFHRIQYALLNPKEISVLESKLAQVKTLFNSGAHVHEARALIERQAVAFQKYAIARHMGADPVKVMFGMTKPTNALEKAVSEVMPIFDKLWNFMERVNNWAKGRGFQSIDDIYNRAFLGKYGELEPDFAMENITASQRYRHDLLDRWRDQIFSVDERIGQLGAEIDQIRTKAAKEGC